MLVSDYPPSKNQAGTMIGQNKLYSFSALAADRRPAENLASVRPLVQQFALARGDPQAAVNSSPVSPRAA